MDGLGPVSPLPQWSCLEDLVIRGDQDTDRPVLRSAMLRPLLVSNPTIKYLTIDSCLGISTLLSVLFDTAALSALSPSVSPGDKTVNNAVNNGTAALVPALRAVIFRRCARAESGDRTFGRLALAVLTQRPRLLMDCDRETWSVEGDDSHCLLPVHRFLVDY